MQSIRETRRRMSRLVLTMTVACMTAALLVSGEATNATEDALQRGGHDYSRPELVTGAFVTREDVRTEIQAMVGPVIESLIQETSAAIDNLRKETGEFATREDVRSEIQAMVWPVIESLIQETSAAIADLKEEIDKLKEQMNR